MKRAKQSEEAIQLSLFSQENAKKSDLRVWYGFTHITPKIARKRALQIVFENDHNGRNEERVSKWMYIAAVRKQTLIEASDAKLHNRYFSSYSMFIDGKPYNGDIMAVLEANSKADENHITETQRREIAGKLLEKYKQIRY
jgi:hypothetical protein